MGNGRRPPELGGCLFTVWGLFRLYIRREGNRGGCRPSPSGEWITKTWGGTGVSAKTTDVIVVGGGVIGCAVALELARSGLEVMVLEREHVGSGASYGAAGMLAPQIEFSSEGPGLELALTSLALFQDWDEIVRAKTGLSLDLDLSGVIRVAESDPSQRELERMAGDQITCGYEARLLDGKDLREWAPSLHSRAERGLWVPGGQVDAARLTRLLAQTASSFGARIWSGMPVTEVHDGAVTTPAGRFEASHIVVATGAWLPFLLNLPLRPVKGQRLLVELAAAPVTRVPLVGEGVYVVPKAGGRYILGATEEPDAGYDRRPTLAGLTEVGLEAQLLFPVLAKSQVIEQWAGLRPAMPDGLPVISRDPRWASVLAVGGHYRHGILLAPVTAQMVAATLIQGMALPLAFAADRFLYKEATKEEAPTPEEETSRAVSVEERSSDKLVLETTIAAPSDVVFAALKDVSTYCRMMPDVQTVDVLKEESSNVRTVQWVVHYLGQRIAWVERQQFTDDQRMQADLISSEFFERYRYNGRLAPAAGGTRVTIELDMVSRRRGLVLAAARRIIQHNLRAFMERLRRELESRVSSNSARGYP